MLAFLGNFLWFILTGLVSALEYFVLGLVWCITIIGIPFGVQCFKFMGFIIWPFGKNIKKEKGHPIANVIWFIFGGFVVSLTYFLLGIIWCITVVGIPFGLQCFKLAKLALAPFGRAASK